MMDAIRAFVQTLLPFEFLQFDFMVNALLAILLLTPLLGLLGTMAVNQQMAFFSDALGHSALTGIGLGILLGVSSDLLAMLVFGFDARMRKPVDHEAARVARESLDPEPG